jgi:hypothetical protein
VNFNSLYTLSDFTNGTGPSISNMYDFPNLQNVEFDFKDHWSRREPSSKYAWRLPPDGLSKMERLKFLSIADPHFRVGESFPILAALPNLESLNFNEVTSILSPNEMFAAVAKSTTIKQFWLEDMNNAGSNQHWKPIQELDLSLLAASQSLKNVQITDCHFDDTLHVSNLKLEELHNLETLYLCQNKHLKYPHPNSSYARRLRERTFNANVSSGAQVVGLMGACVDDGRCTTGVNPEKWDGIYREWQRNECAANRESLEKDGILDPEEGANLALKACAWSRTNIPTGNECRKGCAMFVQ